MGLQCLFQQLVPICAKRGKWALNLHKTSVSSNAKMHCQAHSDGNGHQIYIARDMSSLRCVTCITFCALDVIGISQICKFVKARVHSPEHVANSWRGPHAQNISPINDPHQNQEWHLQAERTLPQSQAGRNCKPRHGFTSPRRVNTGT